VHRGSSPFDKGASTGPEIGRHDASHAVTYHVGHEIFGHLADGENVADVVQYGVVSMLFPDIRALL
jgi:hypothetical protein